MRPCCFAASRTACIVSLFCEANCSNPFGFPAVTSNAMITDIAGLLSRQPTLSTAQRRADSYKAPRASARVQVNRVAFPPDHDIARASVGFICPLVDRAGATLLQMLLCSVGESGSAMAGWTSD